MSLSYVDHAKGSLRYKRHVAHLLQGLWSRSSYCPRHKQPSSRRHMCYLTLQKIGVRFPVHAGHLAWPKFGWHPCRKKIVRVCSDFSHHWSSRPTPRRFASPIRLSQVIADKFPHFILTSNRCFVLDHTSFLTSQAPAGRSFL